MDELFGGHAAAKRALVGQGSFEVFLAEGRRVPVKTVYNVEWPRKGAEGAF